MKQFLTFILIALLFFNFCKKKNPAEPPKEVIKNPREYTWTVDTLEYPGSFQTMMSNIWASSASDVYVVGDNSRAYGHMYHYDGKEWKPVNLNNTEMDGLTAVHGFAEDDIWAVGYNDELLKRDSLGYPIYEHLSSIIHYDGTRWTDYKAENGTFLQTVWGSDPDNVWAGGVNGTLYHYDGEFWKPDSVPMDIPRDAEIFYNFKSITGRSSDEIYMLLSAPKFAGDTKCFLFKHKHNAWALVDSMDLTYYSKIWMSPSSKLYSSGSEIRQYNGTSWSTLFVPYGVITSGMSGTSDDNIFTVGQNGFIAHYNGVDWFTYENINLPDVDIYDVWTDGKEVFAVGYIYPGKSIILHGN